jgi:hypothetical protein
MNVAGIRSFPIPGGSLVSILGLLLLVSTDLFPVALLLGKPLFWHSPVSTKNSIL